MKVILAELEDYFDLEEKEKREKYGFTFEFENGEWLIKNNKVEYEISELPQEINKLLDDFGSVYIVKNKDKIAFVLGYYGNV